MSAHCSCCNRVITVAEIWIRYTSSTEYLQKWFVRRADSFVNIYYNVSGLFMDNDCERFNQKRRLWSYLEVASILTKLQNTRMSVRERVKGDKKKIENCFSNARFICIVNNLNH